MCGVHLIIAKRTLASADPEKSLQQMMAASAFRGPDAAHRLHWTGTRQQIWMGGQRLKITDLNDRANQPMVSPDGRYALLYNGELYNFYELRNQLLAQGEAFRTHSDTEVVLKMLIRQGEAALPQMEGMFALALYDREEETLQLARDPFGIKPLYYSENAHYFLVSSSSQSLIASGLVSAELEPRQIDHYLYFRYAQKGRSLYRDIHALPEGTHLTLPPAGPPQRREFAAPAAPAIRAPDPAELLLETESRLKDAVLRHIATDVPTGLFLSGGVDSTLLLALIKEEGAHPIPTFSVVHEPQDKSFGTQDYRYSRRAAEQYGTYHREVLISPELFEDHFEAFVRQMDQPIGDSGAMMTYLLAQEARHHVKVVLSGAGADELFAGYNRHGAFYWYLRHHTTATTFRGLGKTLAAYAPTGFPHPLRKHFRLAKKFAGALSDDPIRTFLHFVGLPALSDYSPARDSDLSLPPPGAPDFVERHLAMALRHDQQQYLIEDVLAMSDAASMAHSLELRVPYLDAPLVRLARSLPASLRLSQGKKWLLRQLLDQRGGRAFTHRAKEGLGLPFGHWLRRAASPTIRRYLEDSQLPVYRFVSYATVRRLLAEHRRGRHDRSAELWSVLLLSAWLTQQNLFNK